MVWLEIVTYVLVSCSYPYLTWFVAILSFLCVDRGYVDFHTLTARTGDGLLLSRRRRPARLGYLPHSQHLLDHSGKLLIHFIHIPPSWTSVGLVFDVHHRQSGLHPFGPSTEGTSCAFHIA